MGGRTGSGGLKGRAHFAVVASVVAVETVAAAGRGQQSRLKIAAPCRRGVV